MIKVRIALTACAMFVSLILLSGLLGQASDSFLAAIGLQRNAIIAVLSCTSSSKRLIEAAHLGREQRSAGSIGDLANEISAELRRSPTDAELWTSYASLLAVLEKPTQQIGDALKMSYFAAPADFNLMSERSSLALVSTPMSDQVLQTLAEGDLRAILLKQPSLADDLVEIYQRAPESGKVFLMQTANDIAPEFATRLSSYR